MKYLLRFSLLLLMLSGMGASASLSANSGDYVFNGMEPINNNGLNHEIAKIRNITNFLSEKLDIQIEEIGKSVVNKTLYLVRIQSARQRENVKNLNFMVIARQHGNEPAGTNAVLSLISDLANDKRQLPDRLTLLLVPMVNPDGANRDTRNNANDQNLNRDWNAQSQPETKAVYGVFNSYQPEIFLDLHEFTPYADRPFNMTYCPGYGNESPDSLRAMYTAFENIVDQKLLDNKIYCDKSLESARKVGWIPGSAVFAGNQMGVRKSAISYIVETKGIGNGPELPPLVERVKMHRIFVETMLAYAGSNREQIIGTVAGLRARP
jgi:hypothetical protein